MTALQERALGELEAAFVGQINELLVVIICFTPTWEPRSQESQTSLTEWQRKAGAHLPGQTPTIFSSPHLSVVEYQASWQRAGKTAQGDNLVVEKLF